MLVLVLYIHSDKINTEMKTTIRFNGQRFNNPARRTIAKILKRTPVRYEMSLHLIKSRLNPHVLQSLKSRGYYQTRNGPRLVLKNKTAYLTFEGQIESLRDLNRLEKTIELGKYEVIMHYPTYPENIKKIEMFNRFLGKAWKKTS